MKISNKKSPRMTEGRIKAKDRDEEIIAKEEMKAIKESEHMMAKGGKVENQPHPGPSRSEHQKIYDAKKQAESEAELNSPEGNEKRKRENAARLSNMPKPKLFADGGIVDRIRAKKGVMANNEEMPNDFDSLNEEALDFNPDSQMEDMSQPEDSNEHGHSEPLGHDESIVDAIRRKMRKMIG